MPFKGGRKGCYYLEGQSRKGGGLCDSHPEANTIDSCSELYVTPHTLPSSCPVLAPPLGSPRFHDRTQTGLS